jgi:cytochrome c oxidase subunit 3
MDAMSDALAHPLPDAPAPADAAEWRPARGKTGVLCLILMECFFFGAFVVAFLYYLGKNATGPQPEEVLRLGPVSFFSACLFASSATVVLAGRALARGARGAFEGWLGLTLLLGGAFLYGTAVEWRGLMVEHRLFIDTNPFGTTYYSLVGFHALHVAIGLTILGFVWTMSKLGRVRTADAGRIELVSWYWHFVDAVWVVVFTSVYLVGTGVLA